MIDRRGQEVVTDNSELAIASARKHGLAADTVLAIQSVASARGALLAKFSNEGGRIDFEDKAGRKGIVTAYDKHAEEVLRSALKRTGYAFLGEEGGGNALATSKWVVDPIDGTTNWGFQFSSSVISVALQRSGQFVIGIVQDIKSGDMYVAEHGKGAFKNGEKIAVGSSTKWGDQPIIFLNNGYASDSIVRAATQLQRLGESRVIGDFRKLGTTAHELCLLSEGKAMGWIGSGDELWDYAGAIVIAREAGAKVTDWRGAPFAFKNSYLLVSNSDPVFHEKLVAASKDLQRE